MSEQNLSAQHEIGMADQTLTSSSGDVNGGLDMKAYIVAYILRQ